MSRKVNLDAIIPREDFEITEDKNQGFVQTKESISINDLTQGEFFFSYLRKPDFQRETNEWDLNRVCSFVESFLDGDLIPAIILWRSKSGYTFVIDGSHRISALAAWINDDYGDGKISRSFYDEMIPEDQIAIAEETRRLIKNKIGPFDEYTSVTQTKENVDQLILHRAQRLGTAAIRVQWVDGDASKAEASFFKINQQGSPIDKTEIRLIKARKKPNGISARAIIRSGKGHKYWSSFSPMVQKQIQLLAKDNYDLLFNPPLITPIKTMDIPIGGNVYASQSLPLVLDFINIVNSFDEKSDVLDDFNGSKTIEYLIKCKSILERINSKHPGSLGLHPAIYFYSSNGRHKPASFYAIADLILEMEKKDLFKKFTSVRSEFEDLLINYDFLIQQIVRNYRSAIASYPAIKDFYLFCIDNLSLGKSTEKIIEEILLNPSYTYLINSKSADGPTSMDFSSDKKSEVFIREAFSSNAILRCAICNGYLHSNSISIDHIKRKQDGGKGSLENGQVAHFYCNTTFKN